DALLVLVHELDRVLDGDDVAGGVLVAVVDERGERGGFARARAAPEEDQAVFFHHQPGQYLGKAEVLPLRDLGLDGTADHAHFAALLEDIDAEAAHVVEHQRHVALGALVPVTALVLAHDRERYLLHLAFLERPVSHWHHSAEGLHAGRRPRGQEQVGAVLVHHELEQGFQIHSLSIGQVKRLWWQLYLKSAAAGETGARCTSSRRRHACVPGRTHPAPGRTGPCGSVPRCRSGGRWPAPGSRSCHCRVRWPRRANRAATGA